MSSHVVQPWAEQINLAVTNGYWWLIRWETLFPTNISVYRSRHYSLCHLAKDPLSGVIDIDSYRVLPTRVLREQRHTVVLDDKLEFP